MENARYNDQDLFNDNITVQRFTCVFEATDIVIQWSVFPTVLNNEGRCTPLAAGASISAHIGNGTRLESASCVESTAQSRIIPSLSLPAAVDPTTQDM
jgi:hypothetical protein